MASRLSPPSWLLPQQVQGGRPAPRDADGSGRAAGSVAGVARQLGEQALVFTLVLAPPLHVASSNPEAFFGMLNVRANDPPSEGVSAWLCS